MSGEDGRPVFPSPAGWGGTRGHPSWCDWRHCFEGLRHRSAPVVVDTGEAEYSLSLVRWVVVRETLEPCDRPVTEVTVCLTHHTETVCEADPDELGLPLALCLTLGPGEMRRLIAAQQLLLTIGGGFR